MKVPDAGFCVLDPVQLSKISTQGVRASSSITAQNISAGLLMKRHF